MSRALLVAATAVVAASACGSSSVTASDATPVDVSASDDRIELRSEASVWRLDGTCSGAGEELTVTAGEAPAGPADITEQIRIRDGEGWIGLSPEEQYTVTEVRRLDDGSHAVATEAEHADESVTFEIACP